MKKNVDNMEYRLFLKIVLDLFNGFFIIKDQKVCNLNYNYFIIMEGWSFK